MHTQLSDSCGLDQSKTKIQSEAEVRPSKNPFHFKMWF